MQGPIKAASQLVLASNQARICVRHPQKREVSLATCCACMRHIVPAQCPLALTTANKCLGNSHAHLGATPHEVRSA
jgi:hypothetical protein